MHRLFYAFVALSILNAVIYAQSYNQSLNLLAQSYSAPSVNTLLQGYNISNTIIASLIYTKVNFSGNTYLLASLSGRPSLLINTTGSVYSLVLNTGQVSSIIGPGIIQSSLKQINTTYLTVAMQKYNASSSGPLNRCLESTGLSTGATCTYANNCQACTQIPACGGVTRANFQSAFYATGGIYGPLAAGIMQLEAEYANLTKNFSRYYSSVRTLNASNAQTNVGLIEASFSNISTITSNIYQNPIFPPPQTADYNQCSGVGAGTGNVPTSGPWYCSSLGFCEFLTYNYTLLGNIQSYLGSIEALPLSQSQVSQTATNITEFESTYAAPILNQKEHEQALGIANTVLPGYNSFVSGSQALLTHISNTLLQSSLSRLQANYTLLTTNYASANLIALNSTLIKQFAALKSIYSSLNTTYSSTVFLAQNNTVRLIDLQAGNYNPSPQLTALSFREQILNTQVNGKVSNLSAMNAQLMSVNRQSSTISNNPSISQLAVRAISAPIASAIFASMATPYSTAVRNAPLLSIIPSVILGILILALLLRFQHGLKKRQRLSLNKRTENNWKILFVVVIVLVILFIGGTYVAASDANAQAPLATFTNAIQNANSVIIAINGTSSNSTVSCAASIKSTLLSMHKQVQTITISAISCNNGQPLETTDKCLSYYANNRIPVIILSSGTADSITAYSYYGSILSVTGDAQFMNTCVASSIIR